MRSILLEGRQEEKRTVRIYTFYFPFLGLKRIATRYHVTNALAQYITHESAIFLHMIWYLFFLVMVVKTNT